MINDININETVKNVRNVAESIIDKMNIGSRLTTKEFVEKVVEETQVPVAVASGVSALVISNCNTVKARAGRGGGIFKISTEMPTGITTNMNELDDEEDNV